MAAASIARYEEKLPLASLIESPGNPRRHFDPLKLAELAESIRKHGVIEPIMTRPHGDQFEIVVGARRVRAAKEAGLDAIPARVVDLTDDQVLEIQIIENCQRQDVHPLEEAEGFKRLLNVPHYTREVIAEKIGKSVTYVGKRIQLANLIEPLKGKFLAGEIGLGHASLLCALEEQDQMRAAKDSLFEERTHWNGSKRVSEGMQCVPVHELRHWIESNVLLVLADTPWDKADGMLPGGACTACTKRTGSNLEMFDDLAKDDRCLDRRCYFAKQAAYLDREVAQSKKSGAALVRVVSGYAQEKPKGAVLSHEYHEARPDCKKPEKALVVAGNDIGKRLDICRDQKCRAPFPGSASAAAKAAPKKSVEQVWKEKEAALERQIVDAQERAVVQRVMGKVKRLTKLDLAVLAGDRINYDMPDEFGSVLGLASDPSVKQVRDALKKATEEQLAKVLIGSLVADDFDGGELAAPILKAYKIDRKAIHKEVETKMRLAFKTERDAALGTAPKAKKK